MKKILALLLAVMMMATMFTACGLKETVVVAYTLYDPMNYLDENGDLVGFDTELAEAVFEKLGYAASFKLIDWIRNIPSSTQVRSTASGTASPPIPQTTTALPEAKR